MDTKDIFENMNVVYRSVSVQNQGFEYVDIYIPSLSLIIDSIS